MDRHGAFLLDLGSHLYMWIGSNISPHFCQDVFSVTEFQSIQDGLVSLIYTIVSYAVLVFQCSHFALSFLDKFFSLSSGKHFILNV